MERIGQILKDRYCLIDQIGEGGGGKLYLAKDMELSVYWAVKEIPLSRKREALLLKKLQHPSIPRMVDLCQSEETCFLVMEYIQGESLESYMKKGKKLSRSQLWELALTVTDILIYLHGQNPPILYGDLKPSNLMLSDTGQLYLVDMGSAIALWSEEVPLALEGTKGFAAPEQYQGRIYPQSDLYCLGKTLLALGKGHLSPGLKHFASVCTKEDLLKRYCSAQEARSALLGLKKRKTILSPLLGSLMGGIAFTALFFFSLGLPYGLFTRLPVNRSVLLPLSSPPPSSPSPALSPGISPASASPPASTLTQVPTPSSVTATSAHTSSPTPPPATSPAPALTCTSTPALTSSPTPLPTSSPTTALTSSPTATPTSSPTTTPISSPTTTPTSSPATTSACSSSPTPEGEPKTDTEELLAICLEKVIWKQIYGEVPKAEPDFVRGREAGEDTKSASEPNRQAETVDLEEGEVLSLTLDENQAKKVKKELLGYLAKANTPEERLHCLSLLASFAQLAGEPQEAASFYEQMLSIQEDEQIRASLGLLYLRMGEEEESLALYEEDRELSQKLPSHEERLWEERLTR